MNEVRIIPIALAPNFQHSTTAVRHPPVGSDIAQALEHEPGCDDEAPACATISAITLNGTTGSPFRAGSRAETRRPPSVWFSATGSSTRPAAEWLTILLPGSHSRIVPIHGPGRGQSRDSPGNVPRSPSK